MNAFRAYKSGICHSSLVRLVPCKLIRTLSPSGPALQHLHSPGAAHWLLQSFPPFDLCCPASSISTAPCRALSKQSCPCAPSNPVSRSCNHTAGAAVGAMTQELGVRDTVRESLPVMLALAPGLFPFSLQKASNSSCSPNC